MPVPTGTQRGKERLKGGLDPAGGHAVSVLNALRDTELGQRLRIATSRPTSGRKEWCLLKKLQGQTINYVNSSYKKRYVPHC